MKVLYGTDDGREVEHAEDLEADILWEEGEENAWDTDEEEGDTYKSRSQKKREVKALEAMGVALAALGETAWGKLRLSPELRKALMDSEKIRSHGARCRHEKRIGTLMRQQEEADLKAIARFLEDREGRDRRQKGRMQYLESLRDRLAAGDVSLRETLAATPGIDTAHFLFLVDQAVKEKTLGSPKGGRRNLFRYLQEHLPEE